MVHFPKIFTDLYHLIYYGQNVYIKQCFQLAKNSANINKIICVGTLPNVSVQV